MTCGTSAYPDGYRLFAVLLGTKLRIVRNQVMSVRNESKLKVSVVSVAAVLLWVGAFALFREGLGWLDSFGTEPGGPGLSIGAIIMARLLAVLGLALLLMLAFSNVLITYSTLFRTGDMAYLVQAPAPVRPLFLARFAECVWFSSWASAYLGSPLILAYGIVREAAWPFYAAAAAYYIPFIMVPAAIGAMITLVVVRISPWLRRGGLIALAAAGVVLLFLFAAQRFSHTRLSEEPFLPSLLEAMDRTQSPLLPSYWLARGLLDASEARYDACLYYFALLTANALMFTWLATELAARLFYPGWCALGTTTRRRLRPQGRGMLGRLDSVLRFLPQPTRSLIAKDVRLFWRDPAQWSQFVIFFGIMALYVANLRQKWAAANAEVFRTWVVCLNISACMLILATLTSRFVYPLVSLEGRRMWILGLAPVSFRQIVWRKFWLSVATTLLFTTALTVLSCVRLEVHAVPFALAVYSVIATNFALNGLAIGLGSLYPNFQENNPARIVSGMGGTLNFLLSLGYLALVIAAQTVVLHWQVLDRYTSLGSFAWAVGGAATFIAALSVAATLIPMRLGLKNLERSEY